MGAGERAARAEVVRKGSDWVARVKRPGRPVMEYQTSDEREARRVLLEMLEATR